MFSLFPNLLAFEGFAPLFLRLTLGAVFILWGYRKLKSRENRNAIMTGSAEALIGVLLIIGLLTQLAALIAIIILAIRLIEKIKGKAFLTDGINYYLILFIISLTLLITGPGFISFDLPL